MGSMGLGFVTVYAIQRFGVADSTVGLYTAAMLLANHCGQSGRGATRGRELWT